ncbi:Glu-tRNA(Gln) amidotransferase subunit GatE [Candidatus Woesearchaeota archaeon]|nr:Glu-tRNA(Gln) amidotransferase subunit GatE [Candidatus Woesearchaeota archaeon]
MDYEKIGFVCGLEFHQELSGRKLFCNCSTDLAEEKQVMEFVRKLRAVPGESGEVDMAAAYEQLRNRAFTYHGYAKEACLVDTDEEPPHQISGEALRVALEVAMLFKLKVPETICVMRKTVSDGSACSAFQRTMIAGLETPESFIETSQGNVRIQQLNLEEEACKIEKKEGNKVTYSLSRQGIPLLELGTGPDIKNPQHALEVAKTMGMMLRSFSLVKRGIGTIRQDINVSIKGGTRVEVKGWQELKNLPKIVENEAKRQLSLLEIKKELERRGLTNVYTQPEEVTESFKNTESGMISKILQGNGKVYALKLPKFSGMLKKEVCAGKTFGKELAEYAVSYGTKGMIHSDEDLKRYSLEKEFKALKEKLQAGEEDLILIIAEEEQVALRAIKAVLERAKYCLKGIPKETRVPDHVNAISSYARPLPGANRLYPETDVPEIKITKDVLKDVKFPELISEKAFRFEKEYQLNQEFAQQIARGDAGLFEEWVKKFSKVEPNFIASVMLNTAKEIKARYEEADVEGISIEDYEQTLHQLSRGDISKEAVFEILLNVALGKGLDFSQFKTVSMADVEQKVKEIIKANEGAPFNALMGEVMKELRGKLDGKKVAELIKKFTAQTFVG